MVELGRRQLAALHPVESMPEVMTVSGPVRSEDLGITLPHEHIFIDLSCLWHEPKDEGRSFLVDAPIELGHLGLLRRDPYHARQNMCIDDIDLAVAELSEFAKIGGHTVVDLSTHTLGPYPEKLKEVAALTGLNIVAGCGVYIRKAHPDWVASESIDQLAARMIEQLNVGFEKTEIRAGLIGEIGTSSPIHPDEEKVLRAAAIAHRETKRSINVHLQLFAKEGHKVLDILESEDVSLNCVALSHLDETIDEEYHCSLAARGAYIEFDTFGSEFYFDERNSHEPSDHERINALINLIERGFERQLLLSQDVCTKMNLRRFGGMGYDHVVRTILPRLRARGVSQPTIDLITVTNPARFLTAALVG